ncbi:hypothetical protein [Corynebacterium glyciniphilum]|uniref:hypothetical protein n=1 Tax=Corynebacterium glyciniphilum TaxID=1404244 RepID=UPI003FD376DC
MTDTTAVDAATDAATEDAEQADATQADQGTDDPKRTDAERAEHWKTHAREWEDRAKKNLADKDAAEARIAQLEKDLESGTDTTEALATSRAQAARYKAALDAGMDAETADAVLTATDPDQIAAQAAAFKAAVEAQVGKYSAESAPGSQKSEDPNAGSQGASKPDYRAQADRLAKMR